MNKRESEDWQKRFSEMEEELRHAREERDALRAVMKGEASPEALNSIEKSSGAKPMRLMSGEEYRSWVQESVSRRLTGLISAIGIGGLIGLGSLGALFVNSAVNSGMEAKVEDLKTYLNKEITVEVKSTILNEAGLTQKLKEKAKEEEDKISTKLQEVVKEAAELQAKDAVDKMVKVAAADPNTIRQFTEAIQNAGGIKEVVANQVATTYRNSKDNEKKKQALQMLDMLDARKDLQEIQKEILNNPNSAPDLTQKALEVFRPWEDNDEDSKMLGLMLNQFSDDPQCDNKKANETLFLARRNFLKVLGPNHAQHLREHATKDDSGHRPYCLVAETLAVMQDDAGIALKELVAMAESEDKAARKAAWECLGTVKNVPDRATRDQALRAAWALLQKSEGLEEFNPEKIEKPEGEPVTAIQSWLNMLPDNAAYARDLFTQIMQDEDWDSLIDNPAAKKEEIGGEVVKPGNQSIWPSSDAIKAAKEAANASSNVGRSALKKGDGSKPDALHRKADPNMERQLLGALIVEHIQRNEDESILADNLFNLVLQDNTYFNQAGLCRVLAYAMEYISEDTLNKFMTSVGERFKTDQIDAENIADQTHKVTLIAAALRRDTALDGKNPGAAIQLIDSAKTSSGNHLGLNSLLLPAFLSAADKNPKSLVTQITRQLTAAGENSPALRRQGLEISRILLASPDDKIIDAIEDQNLYVSIRALENEETDKELLRMAAEISEELVTRLDWVGRIANTTELVPRDYRPPYDKKLSFVWDKKRERWFCLKLRAETEYRVEVTGGSAELTMVGANQVKVLDRFSFDNEHRRYALPTGQLVGERYLRLRPTGESTEADSSLEIQVYQIPRLGMNHERNNAPIIKADRYADYFRGINDEGGWIRFEAKARNRYILETSGEPGSILELELYDADNKLLRKDNDGLQWLCLKDTVVYGKIRMIDFPGKEQPFEVSLIEKVPDGWAESQLVIADKSAEQAPILSWDELDKGLLIQIDALKEEEESRGFLKLPTEPGQIVEMQSTASVYLSGPEADFPRLNVVAATETDILERSIWWVTEETEHAKMLCAGNLFLKTGIISNAGTFTGGESETSPLLLAENRQFVSQNLETGDWFLPLQGEAGKRYRISFLASEDSGCEMEILSTGSDSRPIGEAWDPTNTDVIWAPAKDDVYRLRLSVKNGPAKILFQAEGYQGGRSSEPFKGLKAGHRVKLGSEVDPYFQSERAGGEAIVLRLIAGPEGDVAILDSGFGSKLTGKRFMWTVANLKPSVKFVSDKP